MATCDTSPAQTRHSELQCSVTVETLGACGSVVKSEQLKSAALSCGRNEFRDVVLRIIHAPARAGRGRGAQLRREFLLGDVVVRGRYASAGKASLKVNERVQLLLYNCPPAGLTAFLRCVSIKFACWRHGAAGPAVSGRQRLLTSEGHTFTEISPLNATDMKVAVRLQKQQSNAGGKVPAQLNKKAISAGDETPKRKSFGAKDGGRPAKRKFGERDCNIMDQTTSPISTQAAEKMLKRTLSSTSTADLTRDQKNVLGTVKAGRSVFFTGSAGTGKSFLLKKIVAALPPETTFVTASTGVAACAIGGITLHSFAGIGSGRAPVAQCKELASRPHFQRQWKKCRTLIIDEISMVDAAFFDKLEAVARFVRNNDKPFGDIQLVVCGDFLQLPPVWNERENDGKPEPGAQDFCFQARSWSKCIEANMELTEVKRQTERVFIDILQKIRLGKCTREVEAALMSTRNHVIDKDGVLATRLCTHKEDVEIINQTQLSKLPGERRTFTAVDSDDSIAVKQSLNRLFPVPASLTLAVGAQVMLCKNLDVERGLVNGARGVVTGFSSAAQGAAGAPLVQFACGVKEAFQAARWTVRARGDQYLTRRQLPLRLAWAISIHKSQGMSLDCVEMSLSRVFEAGQAYVALSRAKSFRGLRILDFDPSCIRANSKVLAFYARLRSEVGI